ncbi:MAG: hypothetical protein WC796_05345 [Candidatus Pacearchaeota archaeon]|jgi:hypothetical protein
MKKVKLIVLIVVVLVIVIAGSFFVVSLIKNKENNSSNNSGGGGSPGPQITFPTKVVNINGESVSLESYLASQDFVKDLPKSASISLKLYNFNSGERQVENVYAITKGSVRAGFASNPDVEIMIHSKYLDDLKNGLCDAVAKAKDNGDVGIETKISTTSLMLKYAGMMKYKSCFGM